MKWKKYLKYLCSGAVIGGADVVPGVSGGTMAFILGIYTDLLDAMKSWLSLDTVKCIFKGDWNKLKSKPFALPFWVVLGILIAVVTLAGPIKYALENHPQYLWAFFFGLVAASVFTVKNKIEKWDVRIMIVLIVGAAGAYFLTGMVPTQTTNNKLFIILCGALAISAMILPGISGSFVLLLIGKYHYILDTVNNVKNGIAANDWQLVGGAAVILICFFIGVFFGLVSFVRLLSFCLKKYYRVTVALLIGFMIGSLRKVWPFKNGEENVLPSELNKEVIFAVILVVFGFFMVIVIEKFAAKLETDKNKEVES